MNTDKQDLTREAQPGRAVPICVHLCPSVVSLAHQFGGCRQRAEQAEWRRLMDRIKNRRLTPFTCLLLAAATLAAYWPVIHHDFINCDDQAYVYANPALQAGLSWSGLAWAFTTGYAGNWHPLTWLSHILDVQWFGLNAGWHHLTNLLLHVANTLLLFLALKRMTGALWRSALVAALFALHPLHVESVAWIAERKDVLSGFFFMLTLWAYARYAEKPVISDQYSVVSNQKSEDREQKTEDSGGRTEDRGQRTAAQTTGHVSRITHHASRSSFHGSLITDYRSRYYLLSLGFFALGLMAKPMLVTLPFLLLLLDFWPLRRAARGPRELQPSAFSLQHLLFEKAPFFALAAASSVVTFLVQQRAGAVADALPLGLRLENALVSYLLYLANAVWPSGLAIFYPYRYQVSAELLAVSVLVLLSISALAWASLRKRPYVAVGWLWFLGTLVPVIGLVQVGQQAMADRYTYLPLIGIFIAVVWALGEVQSPKSKVQSREAAVQSPKSKVQSRETAAPSSMFDVGCSMLGVPPRPRSALLPLLSTALLAACFFATRAQVQHWQNSETLFRHVLAVTTNNALAHESLGVALARQGRVEEAEPQFAEAIRIKPNYPEAMSDLGLARVMRGKVEEGIELYRASIVIKPRDSTAHSNLARALCQQRNFEEAVHEFQTALELNPGAFDLRGSLAAALVELGKTNEANEVFENALRLKPNDAAAHFQYASLLLALGQTEAAALQFRAALQYAPGNAEAHRRYGQLLAGNGNAKGAVEQFREAIRLQPGAEAHHNLAALLLQQGQAEEAVPEYRESLRLSPESPVALNDLAWVLASSPSASLRNGSEAVTLAERACQLTQFREPVLLGTLAAAYAEAGRFADAIKTADKAIDLATAAGQTAVADRNRQLIELYRAGKPYHEKPVG